MLKGYRGSILALFVAIILLGTVIVTRPPDEPAPPATNQMPLPPTSTPLPTLTAAPTISIQQLDTATLHEAVVGCAKKLNPLLAGYNQVDRDITSLIFEGLATTNAYGEPVPDLAASWSWSSDGLVYVVRLRSDVLWHDGIPFSSADVLFTMSLMQDPAFPGPTDLHRFWQTVEADAIDEHTVRFRLAQPLAAFLDYLRIPIVPEHVLRGTSAAKLSTHPFNFAPIGTGPYQFDGLIGGGSLAGVRLRLAATYHERPEGKDDFALRQIVFHCEPSYNDAIAAFQRGKVNSLSELSSDALHQVSALTQLTTYTAWRPAFGAVIYNWQRNEVGYFRDPRMRQALARSVDRAALVNKWLAGRAVVADNPIVPGSWANFRDVTCPGYNPDFARTALTQVQIQPPVSAPDAGEGATQAATTEATALPAAPAANPEYRFQLLVNDDAALANMATDVVNAWNTVGFKASVVVVDTPTFKERLVAGNFDAALVELNLAPNADPDPYSLWRQTPADGGLNFGGMNERRLSELVEAARREVNGIHRAELYHDFERLFCERAAALLLYYPIYAYAADYRIAGIQLGFMSNPSDRFRTIKDWRFTQ
jgi:peptide/nickel transport system substrate-binding protein